MIEAVVEEVRVVAVAVEVSVGVVDVPVVAVRLDDIDVAVVDVVSTGNPKWYNTSACRSAGVSFPVGKMYAKTR